MTTTTPLFMASLYCTDGKSDKEYHAQVNMRDGGFWVDAQYGRRGGTLQSTTKNKKPLTKEKAKSEFDALIKEKVGKGYTMNTSGALFSTAAAGVFTGHVPQLLNPIDAATVEALINDDNWIMQEKFDGHRRMMEQLDDGVYRSINRKGLEVGMPLETLESLKNINVPPYTRLDGELIGSTYWVFDILEHDKKDVSTMDLESRIRIYEALVGVGNKHVQTVTTAYTTAKKRALYSKVHSAQGEGVVFKRKDAPYAAGRPNSGGNQVKFKFYATATFIVMGHKDAKDSVELGLHDVTRSLGFVTIPANATVPKVGALVEVRYLYAYPNGALAQPTYLGVRDDLDTEACTEAQLKFKVIPDNIEDGE